MSQESDWWIVIITGVSAAVGGFMSALGIAFRSAWRLSSQLTDLKIAVMQQNSELAERLTEKFDDKIGELDDKIDRLETRVRGLEQELARQNGRH